MRIKLLSINILCLFLIFSIVSCDINDSSDTTAFQLISFFDLRDRDSFIQLTNTDADTRRIHVQIFDVENNCNENDFFDNYTGNDTHVYNISNIQTNDGNPSGVVLPDNAYGFVVITTAEEVEGSLVGNFRVLDNAGYEYRTNLVERGSGFIFGINPSTGSDISFNYNMKGDVSLSDIVGITYNPFTETPFEVAAAELTESWALVDIDILDLNENVFSCRNVVVSCTDQDNPMRQELLEFVNLEGASANVASFEYGINNAIPHSKGGELLCPGNNIEEGFVNIKLLEWRGTGGLFVGLNNGNGRGSMDSLWTASRCFGNIEECFGIIIPPLPTLP